MAGKVVKFGLLVAGAGCLTLGAVLLCRRGGGDSPDLLLPPVSGTPVAAQGSGLPALAGKAEITRTLPVATSEKNGGSAERQRQALALAGRFRQAIASGDPAQLDSALAEILPAWVALDPEAAANFARRLQSGPLRERILRKTVELWGVANTDAAMAWVVGGNERSGPETLLTVICLKVAETDPERAFLAAADYRFLERNPATGAALGDLLRQWAEKDAPAALQWTLLQPAGEARERFLGRVVVAQARTAPTESMALVLRELSPGAFQEEAVMAVLHQWALRDRTAARNWVSQLDSTDPLRIRARNELDGIERYR